MGHGRPWAGLCPLLGTPAGELVEGSGSQGLLFSQGHSGGCSERRLFRQTEAGEQGRQKPHHDSDLARTVARGGDEWSDPGCSLGHMTDAKLTPCTALPPTRCPGVWVRNLPPAIKSTLRTLYSLERSFSSAK